MATIGSSNSSDSGFKNSLENGDDEQTLDKDMMLLGRENDTSFLSMPDQNNANIEEEHKDIYKLYEKILTENFNKRDQASLRRMAKQESLQDTTSAKDSSNFRKSSEINSVLGNRILFLDCKEGVTLCTVLSMFGVFFTNFAFSSYIFFILIFLLEDPATFALTPELALS